MSEDRETILLVDDDEQVRPVLRMLLSREGYRVLDASDGSEALELLEEDLEIDLLITDVVMPEIGGFELARRVATSHPGIKVLYISGYTGQDGGIGGDQILEPGDHFLQKPFGNQLLAEKVREVLGE